MKQREPSCGRTVLYRISEADIDRMVERDGRPSHNSPGDVVPLIVVTIWATNLAVTAISGWVFPVEVAPFWVGSVRKGREPGMWHWPRTYRRVWLDVPIYR
jgi:hypothetical protein